VVVAGLERWFPEKQDEKNMGLKNPASVASTILGGQQMWCAAPFGFVPFGANWTNKTMEFEFSQVGAPEMGSSCKFFASKRS